MKRLCDFNDTVQELTDRLHVLLGHATRREGVGANTDTTRDHSRRVAGDSVLVERNVHKVTKLFDLRTGEANWTQVPEHEMVVRALGLEAVAVRHELLGNSLRVSTHLLGVLLERRVGGLLEGHGNAGNSVVVGATLACRENSSVYARLQISLAVLAEENEAGTRATQRLVRRRRDNITVLKRTVLLLASNRPEMWAMSHSK